MGRENSFPTVERDAELVHSCHTGHVGALVRAVLVVVYLHAKRTAKSVLQGSAQAHVEFVALGSSGPVGWPVHQGSLVRAVGARAPWVAWGTFQQDFHAAQQDRRGTDG